MSYTRTRTPSHSRRPRHYVMLLQEVPFKCDLGGAPQAEPAHTAEDLKRQLIDGAPWESKRAARRLVELGSEAVPHLCEALAVGTAGVRWVAADALVHFADPRAEWVLCRALADPEATVQVRAIAALARINSPSAADALCGTLRDEDGSVREAAVIALGDLGFPDALESLLPLISDVDPAVRAAATRAVGQLSGAGSCVSEDLAPQLILALADSEELVQLAAIEALGQPRFEQTGEVLLRLARAAAASLQRAAIVALGKQGIGSVPRLCRLLEHRQSAVRHEAAAALIAITEESPSAALRAALPALRRLSNRWSLEMEWDRQVYRQALAVIEAATDHARAIPVPAEPGERSSTGLPVPADAPGHLPPHR